MPSSRQFSITPRYYLYFKRRRRSVPRGFSPPPPPPLHLLPSSCRASTRRRRRRRRCIVAGCAYPNVERCYLRPPQPLSLANEPFAARFIMLAPCFSFLSFFLAVLCCYSLFLSRPLSFASFHFSRVCFWHRKNISFFSL